MAGSINHTVANDGSFTTELLDNMGDVHEALEEYFYAVREAKQLIEKLQEDTKDMPTWWRARRWLDKVKALA